MKSSRKLRISSHLLFVYINNQDRKWRMSVLVFSSALIQLYSKIKHPCWIVVYFQHLLFDMGKPTDLIFHEAETNLTPNNDQNKFFDKIDSSLSNTSSIRSMILYKFASIKRHLQGTGKQHNDTTPFVTSLLT